MNDLVAFIAFIVNLIIFIWFGSTLNSINRHLRRVADHSERQIRLLASVANELAQAQREKRVDTSPDLTEYECDKCGGDIPAGATACPKCGELS
jgi:hypothetical protein